MARWARTGRMILAAALAASGCAAPTGRDASAPGAPAADARISTAAYPIKDILDRLPPSEALFMSLAIGCKPLVLKRMDIGRWLLMRTVVVSIADGPVGYCDTREAFLDNEGEITIDGDSLVVTHNARVRAQVADLLARMRAGFVAMNAGPRAAHSAGFTGQGAPADMPHASVYPMADVARGVLRFYDRPGGVLQQHLLVAAGESVARLCRGWYLAGLFIVAAETGEQEDAAGRLADFRRALAVRDSMPPRGGPPAREQPAIAIGAASRTAQSWEPVESLYPVADLMPRLAPRVGPHAADDSWDGLFATGDPHDQAREDLYQLVGRIKCAVAPDSDAAVASWDFGSIEELGGILIIRQSRRGHEKVAEFLTQLRRERRAGRN